MSNEDLPAYSAPEAYSELAARLEAESIENFDEEDVPAALARETDDGPGTDDLDALPESDFDEEDDDQ